MTSASLVLLFLSLALGERLRGVLGLQVVIVRNSPWAIFSLFAASFISIFGALPQLEDFQTQVFYVSIFLVFLAAPPIIYIALYALKVLWTKKYLE
jgi:hypothetical protein